MKNLKLFLLLFFIPCFSFAQSLNGVYIGVLSNDSTTIRKDQSFEMALTEYNGKVYGYAYSTFIINDTLYYIVKRVKGKIEGDICEVEDDEVIAHNFPKKPEKKVFVTYTLRRNISDNTWKLDGNWKTNLTKRYYAISGKVDAKEEKDLSKSKLYEHLGDLDLQKTLAFNKPKETTPEKKQVKIKEDKNPVAKNTVKKEEKKNIPPTETKPVEKNTDLTVIITDAKIPDNKTTSATVNNQPNQTEKKDAVVTNTNPIEKKPETNAIKTDTKVPDNKTTSTAINNQFNPNEKKNVVTTNSTPVDKRPEVPVAKQESKLPDNKPIVAVNNQPDQNEKKNVTTTNTNSVSSTPNQNEKKDVAMVDKKSTQNKADAEYEFQDLRRKRQLKPAASLVDKRVSVPSETIYFKNDSLSIALYDNGEVDGDTVSVIINDEMFIEKQGLRSSAFRKTFYVPQNESDSLLVVLYADNLGKYPPNTGLLQIKDGEEIFYVRFKADLDRNAAIVLRRKPK
ncbi:MAG TPA: hypothetical protein VGQ04_08145 [Chitinophagaceae bacterium]|jgi:hypothetical protein|nr:hypothetical protein [Chitinophagaceae bacterium]